MACGGWRISASKRLPWLSPSKTRQFHFIHFFAVFFSLLRSTDRLTAIYWIKIIRHAFTVHSLIFHVSHIHTDMPTSHIICISSDFLSYLRLSSFQFFTFLLSTISFFQIHTIIPQTIIIIFRGIFTIIVYIRISRLQTIIIFFFPSYNIKI